MLAFTLSFSIVSIPTENNTCLRRIYLAGGYCLSDNACLYKEEREQRHIKMYTLIKKKFKVFLLLQAVVLGCYCPFVSGFGLRWIPVSTTSARRWRSGGGDDGGRNKATTVLSMANNEAEGMRSKILQLAALTDRGGMACSGKHAL